LYASGSHGGFETIPQSLGGDIPLLWGIISAKKGTGIENRKNPGLGGDAAMFGPGGGSSCKVKMMEKEGDKSGNIVKYKGRADRHAEAHSVSTFNSRQQTERLRARGKGSVENYFEKGIRKETPK